MKIIAAFALGLAVVGLGTCFASNVEYPRAYVSEGQIWVQRSASEAPFQAAHDCADKSIPAVSLDRKQIAYGVACVENDQHVSPMNLVVLDLSGREVVRFASLPMKKLESRCTPGGDIQWIDDHLVAINCEYNPSLEDHLVVNTRTGEIEKEYPGLWFTWSPDHKTVAYVGLIVHFAPPNLQNYCLLLNERTVYTQSCSNRAEVNDAGPFRNIHRFAHPLVWSPDSRNVAFVKRCSTGISNLHRMNWKAANQVMNATLW